MTGGDAQVGNVGVTVVTRSCTSLRASRRSVPRLNKRVIDESCGTDFERIVSSSGSPWSDCSSGTVTRDSTSSDESPELRVWISTRGCANSGKTSTGVSRSIPTPKTIIATPAATTRNRSFRLEPMIQRIIAGALARSISADARFGPEELGYSDGRDHGSSRRTAREESEIPVDVVDDDAFADEGQVLGAGVGPGVAVRLVEHRRVGD